MKAADRAAALALLVGLSACAVPHQAGPGARAAPAQVWVDAYAGAGGNGSREAPLRAIPGLLAPGVELHLRSGLYAGPFVLPEGVLVEGHGEAVLYAEGLATVVEATRATLRNLSLQGGGLGLSARGEVAVERTHFSGHRSAGLRAWPGAAVTLRGCTFEAAVPGTPAIQATGAHLKVEHGVFRSAWRRAVDAEASLVELDGVEFEAVAGAVHALGGETRIRDLSAIAGRGPAIFAAHGRLKVERARVQGHEYGLQTGAGTAVEIDGLVVKHPQESGVALVGTTGTLRHLELEGTGPSGALQVVGSEAPADGPGEGLLVEFGTIKDARSLGVLARKVAVVLRHLTVEGVRAEPDGRGGSSLGDAFHLRDSQVEADDLSATDVEGAGLWASAHATVHLGKLVATRTEVGALVVELEAAVDAKEIVSTGSHGPAVAVLARGTLTLGRLVSSDGGDPPLWAECDQGAVVSLGQLVSDHPLTPARCVTRGPLDGRALSPGE